MKLSIVLSVYNEEKNIKLIYNKLLEFLNRYDYEIIYVNDGSTDNSFIEIKELSVINERVKYIDFSRNFGHESAMKAGLDFSSGDAIIFMDSDMQHPVNLIPSIIFAFENGSDIVYLKKSNSNYSTSFKFILNRLFYFFLNFGNKKIMDPGVSDFFLISKKVSNVIKENYSEKVRFFRYLVQQVGFQKITIEYQASKRVNGKSKYSIIKLLLFSLSSFASTSKAPLRIGIFLSILVMLFSIIIIMYSFFMRIYAKPVSGYTTIVILISVLFSFLFFFLGIIAEYIAIILDEVKNRPNYILKESNIYEKRMDK